jgi:hypothetical protein
LAAGCRYQRTMSREAASAALLKTVEQQSIAIAS